MEMNKTWEEDLKDYPALKDFSSYPRPYVWYSMSESEKIKLVHSRQNVASAEPPYWIRCSPERYRGKVPDWLITGGVKIGGIFVPINDYKRYREMANIITKVSRGVKVQYRMKDYYKRNYHKYEVVNPPCWRGEIVGSDQYRVAQAIVGKHIPLRIHVSGKYGTNESIYCISEMGNDKQMIRDQIEAYKKLAEFEKKYPEWVSPIGNWGCRKEYLNYDTEVGKTECRGYDLWKVGDDFKWKLVQENCPECGYVESEVEPEVESPAIVQEEPKKPEQIETEYTLPTFEIESPSKLGGASTYLEKLKEPKVILVLGFVVLAAIVIGIEKAKEKGGRFYEK